jgi:hypothetical protein
MSKDVAVKAEADSGLKRTAKDLFAGAVGGIAQVLLGSSLFLSRSIELSLIAME